MSEKLATTSAYCSRRCSIGRILAIIAPWSASFSQSSVPYTTGISSFDDGFVCFCDCHTRQFLLRRSLITAVLATDSLQSPVQDDCQFSIDSSPSHTPNPRAGYLVYCTIEPTLLRDQRIRIVSTLSTPNKSRSWIDKCSRTSVESLPEGHISLNILSVLMS